MRQRGGSVTSRRSKRIKSESKFLAYDLFATPIPAFNYQNKTKIGSWIGFIATILYALFFVSFATVLA